MPRKRPINLSTAAFRNLAAALGLATLLSSARADWTLLTADFASQQHLTVNTWTQDGLSATAESGKLTTFPSRDIIRLSFNRPPGTLAPAPSGPRWQLNLRNGDQLIGAPAGISGQSIVFKTPELGAFPVPLKFVASLVSAKKADSFSPGAATDKDLIRFDNGDQTSGIVANIDDAKLQLSTDGTDTLTDVPLAAMSSILFGGANPPRTVPPLSVRLTFNSGSTLTFPLDGQKSFSWTLKSLTLKDANGQDHPATDDQIQSAEILGGRVVFLTELDPLAEEQSTFLGTRWPMQVNKNVFGQPLRVNRTDYANGIGVHTKSTLVYELDGSFDTLTFRVALDDSASPHGQAKAAVVLDGKNLWTSDMLKPGLLSGEISLPVAGGKRLELHADPATHLDVLGRLNWLNVALRRK